MSAIKKFRVKAVDRNRGRLAEYIVTVDEEFAYLLRSMHWAPSSRIEGDNGKPLLYLRRATATGEEYLHYVIAGAEPGDRVVHINGDSLDNRKANLLRRSDRIEEIA